MSKKKNKKSFFNNNTNDIEEEVIKDQEIIDEKPISKNDNIPYDVLVNKLVETVKRGNFQTASKLRQQIKNINEKRG